MDIDDIILREDELELLMKLQGLDAFPVLAKIATVRMDALKEEAIFDIGNDPHSAGLRQGEYATLANFLILSESAQKKLESIRQKDGTKTD